MNVERLWLRAPIATTRRVGHVRFGCGQAVTCIKTSNRRLTLEPPGAIRTACNQRRALELLERAADRWSLLADKLCKQLRAAGLRESTIHSYLMGSTLFVRWLAGDYVPGPGRTER